MGDLPEIEFMPTNEAIKDYPILYKLYKKFVPTLDDDEIAIAISITTDICPYCYEETYRGKCWNDD